MVVFDPILITSSIFTTSKQDQSFTFSSDWYCSPEQDSSLSWQRMAAFEDCQATMLDTQPPWLILLQLIPMFLYNIPCFRNPMLIFFNLISMELHVHWILAWLFHKEMIYCFLFSREMQLETIKEQYFIFVFCCCRHSENQFVSTHPPIRMSGLKYIMIRYQCTWQAPKGRF